MASRRCVKSISSLFSPNKLLHNNNKITTTSIAPFHTHSSSQQIEEIPASNLSLIHLNQFHSPRHFSSQKTNNHGSRIHQNNEDDDDEDEDDDEDDDEEELSEDDEDEDEGGEMRISNLDMNRTYSVEETIEEAAAIGYKVVGPLDPTERPFKHREPYFAVVQIGSHQFKVSNGDCIYTEKLKFCEVNDKLILNKVLMVGSQTQTIIGRPILPDATVHAVVEEHALDAKVIIFKKKRRKNYRRTKGHRQELTRLRITDIEGIEKPEKMEKPEKVQRPRKVAVEA